MSLYLPPPQILFLSAALFGLMCVLRFSCYAGLVDRPICVAALWGAVTGDWSLAIPLGIFCELFWMDLLGAGTYIPPNANLPLLLCLMLNLALPAAHTSVWAGLGAASIASTAPIPLLFIVITLPTAMLATKLENGHRQRQVLVHDRFVEDGQMEKPISPFVIWRSLLELWVIEAALFLILGLILFWAAHGLVEFYGRIPSPTGLSWPVLWTVAAIGGILSLRTRRAVLALCISFGIISVLLLQNLV